MQMSTREIRSNSNRKKKEENEKKKRESHKSSGLGWKICKLLSSKMILLQFSSSLIQTPQGNLTFSNLISFSLVLKSKSLRINR